MHGHSMCVAWECAGVILCGIPTSVSALIRNLPAFSHMLEHCDSICISAVTLGGLRGHHLLRLRDRGRIPCLQDGACCIHAAAKNTSTQHSQHPWNLTLLRLDVVSRIAHYTDHGMAATAPALSGPFPPDFQKRFRGASAMLSSQLRRSPSRSIDSTSIKIVSTVPEPYMEPCIACQARTGWQRLYKSFVCWWPVALVGLRALLAEFSSTGSC